MLHFEYQPNSSAKSFALIIYTFAEPVGSVAPKLNFLERFRMMQVQFGTSFNIQCPVQSYPMPVYK